MEKKKEDYQQRKTNPKCHNKAVIMCVIGHFYFYIYRHQRKKNASMLPIILYICEKNGQYGDDYNDDDDDDYGYDDHHFAFIFFVQYKKFPFSVSKYVL